jgi:hypothetical protein
VIYWLVSVGFGVHHQVRTVQPVLGLEPDLSILRRRRKRRACPSPLIQWLVLAAGRSTFTLVTG